ncbi:MAG TPA: efflux RND transporter periplasmic adaptor subunit [Myxococcales bacterium]
MTRSLFGSTAILALATVACSRAPAASYKSEPVTRGPIAEVVSATGEVSAVTTVSIGSQVSGIISRLYVDFNSKVKEGQVLADLDPRLFEVAHQRALAGLYAAESDREKARLALADAGRAEKRTRELFARSLVARADLETAVSAREGAEAALRGAEARVLQARADRDAAATSVALCRIRSPIDGIVISRNVDVGQTVAASLQAPTLFVIANDLSRMQVLANVDEADVGRVKEGLAARFTVDAFPGEVFHGRIREVRQAPASIQNVVTYAAVVDAPNPDGKLRQGMTAAVTMVTSQRQSALRVANAALRYHPSQDAAAPKVAHNQVPLVSEAWADTAPPQEAETRPGTRRVFAWKLVSGHPVRVPLVTGISDGQRTEVISGLAEGDQVILADTVASKGGKHGPF